MPDSVKTPRRSFLRRSAAAGLAGLAAPAVLLNGRSLEPNEKITVGLIGAGSRGRSFYGELKGLPVEVAAVCDVYETNLARGLAEAVGVEAAARPPQALTNYRELLDQNDIDAVLIATPEHLHAQMLMDAVRAGKDVYCEKPMSHTIEEGTRMVKAVRQTDRIVQVGMQRRSSPGLMQAKELLKECGKIYQVKAYWNWRFSKPLKTKDLDGKVDWNAFLGPANWKPFSPMRFRAWRFFWDYSGGNCTDQGTHLMDVIQWFMDSGPPRSASCHGGIYEMVGAETPDVLAAVFDYEGFLATWSLNYLSTDDHGWNIRFMGKDATLWLDNLGTRLIPTKVKGVPYTREDKATPSKEITERLGQNEHMKNFMDCVKSRKAPNAPVEVGHLAVCGPHLANIAYHHKKQAHLSSDATRVKV